MHEVRKTVGSLRLPEKNRVSQLRYICAPALALRSFRARGLLLPVVIVVCTDIHDFVMNRQVNSLLESCGWSRFHFWYSHLPSSSGMKPLSRVHDGAARCITAIRPKRTRSRKRVPNYGQVMACCIRSKNSNNKITGSLVKTSTHSGTGHSRELTKPQ
jgi:hypothetical protein